MLHTKRLFKAALALSLVFVLSMGGGWIVPQRSAAEESPQVFSRGDGPVEVFVFTDYFCPPCQAVEPYLENALTELLTRGAKVTFIDKPITRWTPLYSRYFLYAANAADSFEALLRIRRTLFDIARNAPVDSESQLVDRMKESNIPLKLFDERPSFSQWAEIIARFRVRSTPTCIVTLPGQDPAVFSGSRRIPEGIDRLIREMAGGA